MTTSHRPRRIPLLLLLSLFATTQTPTRAADPVSDPYRQVEMEVLPNGLKVVYAPSAEAKTFRFKVVVKAGFASEVKETSGISHLLEHYLFTDARLLDADMSYLELIKEKGGSGNGQTSKMETSYFATVPGAQAAWLTGLFHQMLFQREFDDARTAQAKKPVLLEIGQPEPLAPLLDSFLYRMVMPEFLEEPDFWKSEFGIHHPRFSHAHESLNTIRLTAEELRRYYRRFYHPSNITVLVAGKFDVQAERRLVTSLFGQVPDWNGDSLVEGRPTGRDAPYFRSHSTSGTPNIYLGTKLLGIDAEDAVTLRMYLEYLAHRLMKEIRNKRGDTYTVRPTVLLNENFGAAFIGMEAPSDRFRETLAYVRGVLENETRRTGLTEPQFREARELYSSHFTLADRDSGTQLKLAESLSRDSRVYGRRVSEFDAFSAIGFADFNRRLHSLFSAKAAYQQLSEPPLAGRMEGGLLALGVVALFFAFARRAFAMPFDHDAVRWVRKTELAPVYGMEALTLLGSVILASYLVRGLALLFLSSDFIQSSFVYSEYCATALELAVVLVGCIAGCSLLVRKGTVSGEYLYLKSMTYTSIRIPLSEVHSIETATLAKLLVSPKTLWSMKWRFHFWNPWFWRSGTLLRLRDGKCHFVAFRHSDRAVRELSALCRQKNLESRKAA